MYYDEVYDYDYQGVEEQDLGQTQALAVFYQWD